MNTAAFFKLIADADLNENLIRGLRRNESRIDFQTALDGGTRGLEDRQVLELAAAAGRVVVSHDRNTMVGEFYRFLADGHSSPGLIIVTQDADEGDAIDDLLLLWALLATRNFEIECDGSQFDLRTTREARLLRRFQLGVKRWVLCPSFRSHPIKVDPLLTEIRIDARPVRKVVGQRSEDLFEIQRSIGTLDSFRS
jgi:hypothetical protein